MTNILYHLASLTIVTPFVLLGLDVFTAEHRKARSAKAE